MCLDYYDDESLMCFHLHLSNQILPIFYCVNKENIELLSFSKFLTLHVVNPLSAIVEF